MSTTIENENEELKTSAQLAHERAGVQSFPPSADRVAELQRTRGFDEASAYAKLLAEAESEAGTFPVIVPEDWAAITAAMAEAEAMKKAAEAMLDHKRAVIVDLEHRMLERARLGVLTSQLRGLKESADNLQEVATLALDNFCNVIQNDSAETVMAWNHSLTRLSQLSALRPHLPARLKQLETRFQAMGQEIQKIAEAEKINLAALLANMKQAAATVENGSVRNVHFLKQFEQGFFDL